MMEQPGRRPPPHKGATAGELQKALHRLDEDVRDRLLIFDGGPQLMAWQDAHRHHADEPYIGCCFCHDRFLPFPEGRDGLALQIQEALDDIWSREGAPVTWDELGEQVADALLDSLSSLRGAPKAKRPEQEHSA